MPYGKYDLLRNTHTETQADTHTHTHTSTHIPTQTHIHTPAHIYAHRDTRTHKFLFERVTELKHVSEILRRVNNQTNTSTGKLKRADDVCNCLSRADRVLQRGSFQGAHNTINECSEVLSRMQSYTHTHGKLHTLKAALLLKKAAASILCDKTDEAIDASREAIAERPTWGACWKTLGDAQRSGKYIFQSKIAYDICMHLFQLQKEKWTYPMFETILHGLNRLTSNVTQDYPKLIKMLGNKAIEVEVNFPTGFVVDSNPFGAKGCQVAYICSDSALQKTSVCVGAPVLGVEDISVYNMSLHECIHTFAHMYEKKKKKNSTRKRIKLKFGFYTGPVSDLYTQYVLNRYS